MTKQPVKNLDELCAAVGVTGLDGLRKAVYRGTDCGASVTPTENGIEVSSIVEGVDQCTESHSLTYPFSEAAMWEALEAVEKEAEEIWNNTHGCKDCSPPNETGYRAINPECQTCGGDGRII